MHNLGTQIGWAWLKNTTLIYINHAIKWVGTSNTKTTEYII